MTRAIIDSGHNYEGSCRWCLWCLNVVPASIIRCLPCNAILVSVGRFMDQSSLGKPRTLDSEVVIEIEEDQEGLAASIYTGIGMYNIIVAIPTFVALTARSA